MTYCVAMCLDQGLVFLSDSRTNAGVDQISTFRKMTIFERRDDRFLVMMSAGNLAITQAVRQLVCEPGESGVQSVWTVRSLFDAVRLVGDAVRKIHRHDATALKEAGVDFNCSFLFGGQIRGERMRLFQVYAAGNFIETTTENPYFQIGESKYGKPIVDRVLTPQTSLDEAAKCALISMDSTLRSNISVGFPLDLLIYEKDSFRLGHFVRMEEDNPYMQMIRQTWGARLRQVFGEIPDPAWLATDVTATDTLALGHHDAQALRAPEPRSRPVLGTGEST
jgi:putative proteasome-type protease